LISKAIRERTITPLLEAGVTADWFVNPDCKAVWKWTVDHWNKYGEVATAVSVKAEFPTLALLNVEDSLDYILDKFVEHRRAVRVEDTLGAAIEILEQTNDHEQVIVLLEKQISEIHTESTPGTSDLRLDQDPLERFKEYEERESHGGGLLGLPTGFAKIDEATAGLSGGQLITIIAPPKTGKSQLALSMGVNMHEAGHSVLFQSFEMRNSEQQIRHDAMRAKVDFQRMRRANLTAAEKNAYKDMLTRTAVMTNQFTLSDAKSGITVSALAAKIEKVQPELVFVDGVYLMLDEQTNESNTPQALTNITRALKNLALRIDLPIVVSTQTLLWKMKGGKVTADSIGYSSSFFQDSDVILALQPIDNDDEHRELRVEESRHCGKESVTLVWRWETGCFHDDTIDETTCSGCATASLWTPSVANLYSGLVIGNTP
jgi:replicative DNA helicase